MIWVYPWVPDFRKPPYFLLSLYKNLGRSGRSKRLEEIFVQLAGVSLVEPQDINGQRGFAPRKFGWFAVFID